MQHVVWPSRDGIGHLVGVIAPETLRGLGDTVRHDGHLPAPLDVCLQRIRHQERTDRTDEVIPLTDVDDHPWGDDLRRIEDRLAGALWGAVVAAQEQLAERQDKLAYWRCRLESAAARGHGAATPGSDDRSRIAYAASRVEHWEGAVATADAALATAQARSDLLRVPSITESHTNLA